MKRLFVQIPVEIIGNLKTGLVTKIQTTKARKRTYTVNFVVRSLQDIKANSKEKGGNTVQKAVKEKIKLEKNLQYGKKRTLILKTSQEKKEKEYLKETTTLAKSVVKVIENFTHTILYQLLNQKKKHTI